jgi:EAL domain-containing protein (putative c-di-GMP-specific phosphodiesterase class I)
VDDLLKQADMAMYMSKEAGRNAIRFFNPSQEQAVKERADMEHDLRLAIANRQFQLYYQPQVTEVNNVTGAECLLRWTHSSGRMVSPVDFIGLAEETGLIVPLGQWVLETACMQLAVWAENDATAHLVLAVNVSAVQFHQADFVETVLTTIERTRANPQRLKIELTESLLVSNITETIEVMHRLKARGVGFSLDDFGTGFSSLSYLKRLPLDQLKIDQTFVRDLLTDPNDAAIAKTIIALGQSLGLAVIAEGVETQAQREFLARSGCYAYQGYLFSRPVPLAAFEAYAQAVPIPGGVLNSHSLSCLIA